MSLTRIEGYDFARALAILGMMIINVESTIADLGAGPSWLETCVTSLEGRAAPVFVILAGISVTLMSRRCLAVHDEGEVTAMRYSMLKRGLFLFVLGLFHRLTWLADILHYYGVYLIIGAGMITVSTRWIWLGILMAAATAAGYMIGFEVYQNLNWDQISHPAFHSGTEILRHIFLLGYYPVFPWIALFLFGMWFGRLDVRRPYFKRIVGGAGLLLFGGSHMIFSRFFEKLMEYAYIHELYSLVYLIDIDAFPATTLYLFSAAGTSLMVIAAGLAVVERYPGSGIVKDFITVGQFSLTLYVAHTVIGINGLELFGFGTHQPLIFSVIFSITFFIICLAGSHCWKKHFTRGPLEWVMRYVSRSHRPLTVAEKADVV